MALCSFLPPPSIKDIYHNVVYTNPAYGCTIAFNKIARNKALEVLQDKKPIMYHDEIICRICVAYGKATFIDTPLMIYRRTGSNVTDAHNNARLRENLQGGFGNKLSMGYKALLLRIKVLHLLGIRPINYFKILYVFTKRYLANES